MWTVTSVDMSLTIANRLHILIYLKRCINIFTTSSKHPVFLASFIMLLRTLDTHFGSLNGQVSPSIYFISLLSSIIPTPITCLAGIVCLCFGLASSFPPVRYPEELASVLLEGLLTFDKCLCMSSASTKLKEAQLRSLLRMGPWDYHCRSSQIQ